MKFLKNLFGVNDDNSRKGHPLREQKSFRIQYPNYGYEPDKSQKPQPVYKKVLTITHDPVLHSKDGITVKDHFRWNDSDALAAAYAEDVKWASYGYANYEIVDRIVVDGFPIKRDGFRYDEHSYLKAWEKRSFHDPDGVDYLELVREFKMIERVDSGEIDEVWLFGHPYGGYYESIMCGPNAFWCNAPALKGTEHAQRQFVIMGFNFERGVGEMLEDLGHRAESMLFKVYEQKKGHANNWWERFLRIERDFPGKSEVGSVHFAPNSVKDYDWGNKTPVLSYCDNWYHFPDLSGEPRLVDCREWGNGDIRLHHLWWFRHMPHIVGEQNGILSNWWEYIIDSNRVQVR
jgi:hypothetical protein